MLMIDKFWQESWWGVWLYVTNLQDTYDFEHLDLNNKITGIFILVPKFCQETNEK